MSQLDPVRVHYIQEITRLHLWYVDRVVREEGDAFAQAVNRRVNIYRNTALFDGERHPTRGDVGPEWARILERLEEIHERHRREPSTARFEEEGLALLWPCLEARIRGEGDPLDLLKKTDRPYECWCQDFKQGRNNIHIDNLYRPQSPLSDMFIPFAASLIRLLRDAQAERPDIQVTRCSTWMNASPRFQSLFPRRWMEGAEMQREVQYTNGYWGQFMDRRGDFHARNGSTFRETGELPFPSMGCECPTEEVLAHLESRFPEAVRYNAERGVRPDQKAVSPGGSE